MSLWTHLSALFGGDAPRDRVEAAFPCSACAETAATVRFLPRGLADPASDVVSSEAARVVVEGFSGTLTEVVDGGGPAVARALEAADAEALWQIDPLWAPFYCPDCGVVYCRAHWTQAVVYADAPGWYEQSTGRCPHGHARVHEDRQGAAPPGNAWAPVCLSLVRAAGADSGPTKG